MPANILIAGMARSYGCPKCEKDWNMSADEHNAHEIEATKYPWAGPALFTSVLIAVIVFFAWFLRA